MFLDRSITQTLLRFAKFPVVGLFGPRQSGKTTLVKNVFSQHKYFNFEDPSTRERARTDPAKFLRDAQNAHGIILDEFQYLPEILSYIQIESDEKKRPGYFVLTGSQNFLMNQAVTQSLAGRIGILTLLPLAIQELIKNNILSSGTNTIDQIMFSGGYPKIYTENFTSDELYPSYIQSYVERDVRQLINIENLRTFQKFMQLCAGRVGQLLNIADIATSCGISQKTADSWLAILQASYIIFLLNPYHENFNKRVIKTPKLYFYDTGLACSLLGLRSAQDLSLSVFRGHIFESFMISDLFKQYFSLGSRTPLYFWRDKNGAIEVDCIVNLGLKLVPIEIKSGETINNSFFDGLVKWSALAQGDPEDGYVIYAGLGHENRSTGRIVGWQEAGSLIEKIDKN